MNSKLEISIMYMFVVVLVCIASQTPVDMKWKPPQSLNHWSVYGGLHPIRSYNYCIFSAWVGDCNWSTEK